MRTGRSSAEADPKRWPCGKLFVALVIMFVIQMLYLPCLCHIGAIKLEVALYFDALMFLRILVATLMRQRGRDWKIYFWALVTSPFWIEGIAWLAFGRCG